MSRLLSNVPPSYQWSLLLTNVSPPDDVTALAGRPEVVEPVVDLEATDAALEPCVKAEEVALMAHVAHAAHVHRLVERDPGEEALKRKKEQNITFKFFKHLL